MVKGKAKQHSGEDLPPPQTRSLRSRKREHPADEAPEADAAPAALHQQDKAENHTEPQDPAAEQSCSTEEEKHTNEEETGREVDSPNIDSQPEGCGLHTSTDTQTSTTRKEPVMISEHQIPADHLRVVLPVSDDAGESCANGEEERADGEERNRDTSNDKPSPVSTDDAKESAVGPPAKRRRRMGMCGLTEKERSQFLQAQKQEHGTEKPAENLIRHEDEDLLAPEEGTSSSPSPSSPLGISALSEAELKPQSSPGEENDRAKTEVHFTVPASDGTTAVRDPGCSEGETCEAEVEAALGPDLTANPESRQLGMKDEEGLENLDTQELEGPSAENMAEMCEKDVKKTEEVSPESSDGGEEASKQKATGTDRTDQGRGEVVAAADATSRGPDCHCVEPSEAAGTPGVPERENNCDPDDDPAADLSTVNAQTRNPDDTFGSGCIDDVSDSQLNTIVLSEWVKEKEEDSHPHPPDCIEDATDLIRGLIGELSCLNRKVMAAHRELENMRRSSKTSRSSVV